MLWPHRLFSPRPQCAAAILEEMWGPGGFIPYLVSLPLCVIETPNLSSISNISNLSNKRSFSSALTCMWRASWSVQRRGLRRSIFCVGLLKKKVEKVRSSLEAPPDTARHSWSLRCHPEMLQHVFRTKTSMGECCWWRWYMWVPLGHPWARDRAGDHWKGKHGAEQGRSCTAFAVKQV